MTRARWALVVGVALAALFGGNALAAPPPWANAKPRKTTTTVAATTTTVAPTTTAGPTTTTAPGCGGPLTISTGGTYSGCYESLLAGTPAVTVATSQAVTLDRAEVRHRGRGIVSGVGGVNLTVTNTLLQGLDPSAVLDAPAVYLFRPASVVLEHNRLVDGQGVLINGDDQPTVPLQIRYNDFTDIGRWNASGFVGAVHFDKVAAPGALVHWNRVVNHHGRSVSEDVIGLVASNGAAGSPIDVGWNLIDGSYPYTGNGAGFTGGGIDTGDVAGSWQTSHDNTVVRVTNNGLMIPAGSNLEHAHNRVVGSGIADDGVRVSSTFGNGLNLWSGYATPPSVAAMHHNSTNHRRWTGSAWERNNTYMPACDPPGACVNNVSGTFDNADWDGPTNGTTLGLTDDAAWLAEINDALADWEATRIAAGVTVGPLP